MTTTTDGVRGIPGPKWSERELLAVALGCAVNLSERGAVAIGFDGRAGASELAGLLSEYMASEGVNHVLSDSMCVTPAVGRTCASVDDIGGGIMFTASHNPPGYIGVKIRDHDGGSYEIGRAHELIAEYMECLPGSGASKRPSTSSLVNDTYITSVVQALDANAGSFRGTVVIDSMFGAAARYRGVTKHLAWHRGHAVPYFWGICPDPVIEVNRGDPDLIAPIEIDELRILTDGDGDRIAVATRGSGYVSSSEIAACLLPMLPEIRAVISTVVAEMLLRDTAEHCGRQYYQSDVGFKNIAALWNDIEHVQAIGVEPNGGLAIADAGRTSYFERDGLWMAARLTETFSSVRELDEQVGLLRERRTHKQILISVKDTMPRLIETFLDHHSDFKALPGEAVATLIGRDNARVLVRPSGTEDVTRVYLEVDEYVASWFGSRYGVII